MTTPMPETMSLREKVAAVLDPEIWADDMPVPTRAAVTDFHARRKASVIKADAILAALASGSGDHAELARLAVVATDAASLGDGLQEAALTRFQAHANPATVLALLAENAALRGERDEANASATAWSRTVGEMAVIGEDWKERCVEAERKLAEAVGHVEQLVDRLHSIRDSSIVLIAARTFLSKEAERG